jgi:hypothetical protein
MYVRHTSALSLRGRWIIMAKKYDSFSRWLRDLDAAEITTTFAEIDVLVNSLPPSARADRTWWGNSARNSQAAAWIAAGWIVESVDIATETVRFRRGEPAVRGRTGRDAILDGSAALDQFVRRAGWSSVESAVAAHTIFLHPRTVAQTKGRAIFPVVRDPQRRGQLGHLDDGRNVLFDDNATPTDVFLWAADRVKGPDVQFNHVWSRPTDPEMYTALWNLCCTPAFLAKTSDTHPGVTSTLRYRSFELYGVVPPKEPMPVEPHDYSTLLWAAMPPPVDDLERLFRARMRAAPSRRGVLAARSIGWVFSSGPDPTV